MPQKKPGPKDQKKDLKKDDRRERPRNPEPAKRPTPLKETTSALDQKLLKIVDDRVAAAMKANQSSKSTDRIAGKEKQPHATEATKALEVAFQAGVKVGMKAKRGAKESGSGPKAAKALPRPHAPARVQVPKSIPGPHTKFEMAVQGAQDPKSMSGLNMKEIAAKGAQAPNSIPGPHTQIERAVQGILPDPSMLQLPLRKKPADQMNAPVRRLQPGYKRYTQVSPGLPFNYCLKLSFGEIVAILGIQDSRILELESYLKDLIPREYAQQDPFTQEWYLDEVSVEKLNYRYGS